MKSIASRIGRTAVMALIAVTAASCGKSSKKVEPPLVLSGISVDTAEPTRLVVVWSTNIPTDGVVKFGTSSDNLSQSVAARAMTTLHRASLENLVPATAYYYSVTSRSASGAEMTSEVHQAETPSVDTTAKATPSDFGYDVADISTRFGHIIFRFYDQDAPRTVANFKKLAREGFYNGTTFHRVIPTFVIQGGDPLSKDNNRADDGTGGPGYTLPAEIHRKHDRGAVAMARAPDSVNPERRSNGSQFYICVAPVHQLDGQYTVFGQVVKGMDVVEKIANVPRDKNDNPLDPIPMKVTIRHIAPGQQP